MTPEDAQKQLTPLREKIDLLDKQLVDLLNERAKVVVDIGQIKRDGSYPIYAPDRELNVLNQISQFNQGPLSNHCLMAIWRELMSGSFALERSLKVGYLGPAGSFSHLAARLKFGGSIEYSDCEDIPSVFDDAACGRVDLGLVPIENSAIGGVAETLDTFLDRSVKVFAEVLVRVHHNLLANCSMDQIKRVYSRPEVFGQCRRWLGQHLPGAERLPVASSSKASQIASTEPNSAAIGSSLAGEVYKLQTVSQHIEDSSTNVTRFFVISTEQAKPSGDDKTAVMFTTSHQPGALAAVLDVFRDRGLNLTHIDKRPSQRVNWEYYFFVDFLGHDSDPNVQEAIQSARSHCLQLKVLGSFPRAVEPLG